MVSTKKQLQLLLDIDLKTPLESVDADAEVRHGEQI